MTSDEVKSVLAALPRHTMTHMRRLIVFRLSACCGLRRSEIAGLDMRDFSWADPTPFIHVRAEIAKGKKKSRVVPLWWDKQTRRDLERWFGLRGEQGASGKDPFVCSQSRDIAGKRCRDNVLARVWRTALSFALPTDRVAQLSIHCGRHTFCSLALQGGRSAVEVRDAAGHASIAQTDVYLHSHPRFDVPDLFS